MTGDSAGGRKAGRRNWLPDPLPPAARARFDRRLAVLLGLVPLPEMTQEETDWIFGQKVRPRDDD